MLPFLEVKATIKAEGNHAELPMLWEITVDISGEVSCWLNLSLKSLYLAPWEKLQFVSGVLENPCCCSVAQSCPTICSPMDCSTPGLPVHHHLPEFAHTHVHRVSDAIQPSHPLSSPSPPAFYLSQDQRVFSNESALHIRWPKYWRSSFGISPSNEY